MNVSVVIPTHNRPDRTRRAIESVLTQTRMPGEVIVVDDASDPPFEFVSSAANRHLVRIVRLESNRGASGARQVGVDTASGTHIALLDSDDTWTATKLEAQLAAVQSTHDADRLVLACAWEVVDPDSGEVIETRTPVPTERLIDLCSGCWYAPGSTALIPRELLASVGGYDTGLRRLEDLDLFIKLGLAGGRLGVVPSIGARIERGRNAQVHDVAPAVEILRQRYLGEPSPLNRSEQRRLGAWLDLELAASHYFARRWAQVAWHLARSWIRVPRRTLQLRRWWS